MQMKIFIVLLGLTGLMSASDYSASKQLIDALYQQALEDQQAGKQLTQSQAHLLSTVSIKDKSGTYRKTSIKDQVLYKYASNKNFILPNADRIKNAFERERSFRDNPPLGKKYYVFYTAIPYMHLMQDLAKELYLYDFGAAASAALQQGAFQFLRYFHNDPYFDQYKNVQDYLNAEIRRNKIIDDNLLRNKIILLSTNLSFFGNVGLTGESTFFYFNKPQKWSSPNPMFIEDSLNSYGFLNIKQYSDQFLDIIKNDLDYFLNEGITDASAGKDPNPGSDLFQIFIPEDLVDNIAYKSWRQGFPFDIALLKQLFPAKLQTAETLDDSKGIVAADITSVIEKVQAGEMPGISDYLLNFIHSGFSLKNYLQQKYIPKKDSLMNFVQARILITNEELLNPESGIFMYRYSSVPEETLVTYQEKFNQVFEDMIAQEPKVEAQFDVRLINLLIKMNSVAQQDPIKNLTQTQVLFDIQDVANKIKQIARSTYKNKQMIFKILQLEQAYESDYYVFYTAVPYMRLFQDIAYILNKSLKYPDLQDFQFLRFDVNNQLYEKYQNTTHFLLKELSRRCIIDDRISSEIKSLLLSVNVSLFGNIDFIGESTWGFFNIPQSWAALNKLFIKPMLEDFNFPLEVVDELIKHTEMLKDDTGSMPADLMQVFIPKKLADELGYISWTRGIPFDPAYIQSICQFAGFVPKLALDTFGKEFAVGLSTEGSILGLMMVVEAACKTNKFPQGIVDNLKNNVQSGDFYPSSKLKNPLLNPDASKYYEHYQARILFTKDGMLNPNSGIKIFRYSQLTPGQEQAYNESLQTSLTQLIDAADRSKSKSVTLQQKIEACLR